LQPIEGVTVAWSAVNLPGPLVASRVAEFGASVTRVEPPAGDPPPHASRARCLNTPLRAPARPSGTGYAGDAGMFGGAYPGCGIHESADGHVALSAVEPHFFGRALRASRVDGCRDAIRGAFAARPPASWKPLPHRQISPEPGPVEVVDVDFVLSDAARLCAGQPFISPKTPASSIYRRVTPCQAVRARLPFSGRQGKEIGSDGSSNVRGCEGVRRGRLSGTTGVSIAALNSTAGSSFGDPSAAASAPGRPVTDETMPKTAVPPLFRPLRLPAASASARRAHPGSRCSMASHSAAFNMSETCLILIKQRYPDPVEHRRDTLTVSSKIKHARGSRLPSGSG
jgi:hypothetical protein